jgi:hypothetical protein
MSPPAAAISPSLCRDAPALEERDPENRDRGRDDDVLEKAGHESGGSARAQPYGLDRRRDPAWILRVVVDELLVVLA